MSEAINQPASSSGVTAAASKPSWHLAWVVFGAALLASVFPWQILGFGLTGWGWVIGLLTAVAMLAKTGLLPVAFPFQYWLPWVAVVLAYIGWGFEHAVQNAAQIISPLVVGMAASTLRPGRAEVESFLKGCRVGAIVFLCVVVFVSIPMLLWGRLPETTGLAPQAMTAMLFQSLFLCSWLLQRNKADLVLYLACAAFVVISLVRGVMLGSLALVVFTLAPLSLTRRMLIAGVAVAIGLGVFQMPTVQKKMFWSGHGTLEDLRWENPNLRKHTRDLMWKHLWSGVQQRPWFGHGGNASATDLVEAGFGDLPHNDWLRILFNYGIVGCVLYGGGMLLQIFHGWRWAKRAPPPLQVLLFGAISSFVPYAVVMFLDNILIYATFFGNLQFFLLGFAYGSLAAELEQPTETES